MLTEYVGNSRKTLKNLGTFWNIPDKESDKGNWKEANTHCIVNLPDRRIRAVHVSNLIENACMSKNLINTLRNVG